MDRSLGAMERALVRTDRFAPLTAVAVVRLKHAPAPQVLREALTRLQAGHALLRVGLAPPYRHFETRPNPVPLRVLDRSDEGGWLGVAERELATRIDIEREPPLRCSYLWSGGGSGEPARAELCLALHHTVVDGASGARLLDELLGDLAGVGGHERAPVDIPPPADELMPPGSTTLPRRLGFLGRQLRDEFVATVGARGRRTPIPPRGGASGVVSRRFDTATTAALARKGRRARLGLAALVHAAMMLALHRHRGGPPGSMTGVLFADLRPYLVPPVPEDALGCYIAMLRIVVPVETGDPTALWSLAERVQRSTLAAGRRGDKFTANVTADLFMRLAIALGSRRMGDTALSYGATLPLAERYGGLVVDDVHVFIANNALGPVFTAQARIFAGRLGIDIVHLHDDFDRAEAAALADDTVALLVEATDA